MTPRSMSDTVSGVRSAVVPVRRIGRARLEWLLVAGTVAALLALAVYQIKAKPFWYDEAMSITFARLPFDRFVALMTGDEANSALYYVILKGWRMLGEGEARIRFLSVLLAIATIPILYLVGRRHVGRTSASAGCVLFAISPFVIAYAQEARAYAFAMLAASALVLAWSMATETGQRRWWVAYALLGSASLYVHFFCGFVVLALGLTWLLGLVPRSRDSVLAQAAIAAAAVPIAVFVANSGLTQVSWIKPFSEAGVAAVLGAVGGGTQALSFLLYGAAIVAIPTRDPVRIRRIAPIVAWWLTPVAAGLGLSLWHSLLEPRYFIVALPPLLLLAGAGFARAGGWVARAIGRPTRAALVAVVPVGLAILLAVGPVDAVYTATTGDWRAAADWVARTAEPGDRIVYYVDRGRYPFGIYLERYTRGWPVDATVDEVRASTGRTWLVFHLTSDYQQRLFRESLPGYRVVESKVFNGLRVQLLERPSPSG
jgi:mannosyltransferase